MNWKMELTTHDIFFIFVEWSFMAPQQNDVIEPARNIWHSIGANFWRRHVLHENTYLRGIVIVNEKVVFEMKI